VRRAALVVPLLALLGCSSSSGLIAVPPGGSIPVGPATSLAFHARVEAFYERLIRRLFNALETFNDPELRRHFRSEERFFDYYAELAQSLADAHFERSRPRTVTIQEFVFEDPAHARVQVYFVGDDNRPLRPGSVDLVRVDRWQRTDDSWWVTPGRL